MLYLILNENGEPENRWSIEPEKDFVGLTVFGPALKDGAGEYERGDWVDVVDGKPSVNQAKKESTLKAERDEREAEAAKREADRLARDSAKATAKKAGKLSADEIEAIVRALAKNAWGE